MTKNKLRRLIYTTSAIGVLGALVSTTALDRVVETATRGDTAIEAGTSAISAGGGPLTPGSRSALVNFERANNESSRTTLLLGLSATLTPLLIFLNVVGFAGFAERELMVYRIRRANHEEQEGDDPDDAHSQSLSPLDGLGDRG
jgi:hypothetical protein